MKLWTLEWETKQRHTNSVSQKAAKVFNIFDLILIGLGSSLAIGTSVLIGDLITCVTGPAAVVSIFLAGVTALVGGLCLAEFGVQFLKVDSPYSYSYYWGKDTDAFIFGWAIVLEYVAGTASVAKGIMTFTDALTDFKISDFVKNISSTSFPDVFPYFDYFSFAIILIITIVIAFGLNDSIILKKLLTICSIVLLVSSIIAGALWADVKNWQNEDNTDGKFRRKKGFVPFGSLNVVKGAAIAFYGFIGFDAFSFSGNEIKKRKKNLPLAILATIFLTLIVFSGTGVVLTLMLPYTELSSYAALPFALEKVGWIEMKWIAVVAAFFSFQTSFFGVMFPLPRIIHAMGCDGLLFYCLGNNHNKFKTPIMAIMAGGLLAAVGAGIFTFQILVNLAVFGALFVYTIIAINVILLRYIPKRENNNKMSWKSLMCSNNSKVTVKLFMQNYFNFKEKQPTDLTKIIIMGNLVLFCICSVGLGIIFNVFYDFLVRCTAEAIAPASILLCILLCNIISICCQPKSQFVVPFKVPLFPFTPCLSIFLNIFLMMTFDSTAWLLFSTWMIGGILPYFLWHFLKYLKGEVGKTSLYEINKTNAVKLNESIWKIKSDKKSFYEGAVNPVFSYDLDDDPHVRKENVDSDVKKHYNETPLELKYDETIQKAESDVEEKIKYLESKLQLNFIPEVKVNNSEDEDQRVHWECVAEIHTEEEFSPESIALEIVDNTYNFLSEVSEELSKDVDEEEFIISKSESDDKAEKESSQSDLLQSTQKYNNHVDLENSIKKPNEFNEKLLCNFQSSGNSENNEDTESRSQNSSNFENEIPVLVLEESQEEVTDKNQSDSFSLHSVASNAELSFRHKNHEEEQFVYLIVETLYEAHQGEMILKQNNTTASKKVKPVSDEQKKIKDFKEKLNQILKTQINGAATFLPASSLSKSITSNNSDISNEMNKNVLHNSIKTLNKSQIKSKLELLLAKKPPVRPSLKSSFNISLNEITDEKKLEKTNEDRPSSTTLNSNKKEESIVNPSFTLADRIREKILSLKNVDGDEVNDICC